MNRHYPTICFLLFMVLANSQNSALQYWRSNDQRGLNVFENKKEDTVVFEGIRVRLGGSFTQQFQHLTHLNTSVANVDANGKNLNQLIEIGPGFNLATANLNLDVQLEDGIRMNLTAYLSSRHHPESWVKGGYVQFDKLPFLKSDIADKIMNYITIRAGHYEINYGDAHFRRSDNGNTIYNPFSENYILDAFTTEIGGELIFQHKGFLAMGAITGGEIQGGVTNPGKRNAAFIGKLGYDKMFFQNLRFRLTASVYTTPGSVNNTLYFGDRAGSKYYMVMENILATTSANAWSGRFNPSFNQMVTAVMINPFIKFKGIELFGVLEQTTGKTSTESSTRTMQQIGVDVVYRFGKQEQFFVAGRYNQVTGKQAVTENSITIQRVQASGGWFITKNILAKIEGVNQDYMNFAETDIRNGGRFYGFLAEAVLSF